MGFVFEGGRRGKFRSARRVFRVPEIVGLRGEDLTAKRLAREIGTNLSSCYYLLNILADEGCIEKIPRYGGYGVAEPVRRNGGKVKGAIGLMTTARRVREEGRRLVEKMVRWAAAEASALLTDVDYEGRNECPS